jgi:hypothetical protein
MRAVSSIVCDGAARGHSGQSLRGAGRRLISVSAQRTLRQLESKERIGGRLASHASRPRE